MKPLPLLFMVFFLLSARSVSQCHAAESDSGDTAATVPIDSHRSSSTIPQTRTSSSATVLAVNQVVGGQGSQFMPVPVSTLPDARVSLPMPISTDSAATRWNQQQPPPASTQPQPTEPSTPLQQQPPASPGESEGPEPPAPTLADVDDELKQAANYSRFLTDLRDKLQRSDPKAVPEGVEKPTVAEVEEELKQVQTYIEKLNQFKQQLEKGEQPKMMMMKMAATAEGMQNSESMQPIASSDQQELDSDDSGGLLLSFDDGLDAFDQFDSSQFPPKDDEDWKPRRPHRCPEGWRGRECRRRRRDADYWYRCRIYGDC